MTFTSKLDPSGSENSQDTAHKLLIELLSYQFAYPVRWIETQDAIFRTPRDAKRLVEIGPSKVLSTMAQKTIHRKYSIRDKIDARRRQLLSYNSDRKSLYYEYEPMEDQGVTQANKESPVLPPSDNAKPLQPPSAAKISQSAQGPSVPSPMMLEDVPLRALDLILAIVGQKLKRPVDDVSPHQSIRDLSAGKSTLQNELIGDLDGEFGNLPDEAETMALQALASSLDVKFAGSIGKTTSKLVSKLVSSKMPAGFNQAAMRQYLSSHWGFGPGRQSAVICFAVTVEPASRMPDIAAAKEFLDTLAARYARYAELTVFRNELVGGVSPPAALDSAGVEVTSMQQKGSLTKQPEMLARYIGNDDALADTDVMYTEVQREASEWALRSIKDELGDDFLSGIRPIFHPAETRTYDSSWNWVREDLVSLFLSSDERKYNLEAQEVSDAIYRVMGRWDGTCDSLVEYLGLHFGKPENFNVRELLRKSATSRSDVAPVFRFLEPSLSPVTGIGPLGKIEYTEVPRQLVEGPNDYSKLIRDGRLQHKFQGRMPFIHLRRRHGNEWHYHQEATDSLIDELARGCSTGLSFAGKTILITGAGPQSIGAEVIKGLLQGGADVIVTTSRSLTDSAKFYDSLFKDYGARRSRLTVLPFNQASKKDCEDLIEHIYNRKSGLATDLDFIIPFAAISETGREIDGLDSRSELAHRLMLTNLLRLLGFVKQQKQRSGFDSWPTGVILPLSPNKGIFGGDGLYSESKIALESLLARWYSESWSSYLTITGAVIGWTRGTGLMNGNDILAASIESHNALTFSQSEMAFNILALMTSTIAHLTEEGPVYADLTGGLQNIAYLKGTLTSAREELLNRSKLQKALAAERTQHEAILQGEFRKKPQSEETRTYRKRANLNIGFPQLPSRTAMAAELQDLQGMVDLSRVIVVVGYSELGPWGSARTRFEMEHQFDLSMEGCIELAWMMGLVKHHTGEISGEPYSGWIDSRTQQPVNDDEFYSKYRDEIFKHSGIRFIEPGGLNGYDPAKKEYLHEVVVDEDLPAFEASKTVAEAFKLRHGDKVRIGPIAGSEEYKVKLKKGTHFLVPKAAPFPRKVAGQLPTGWNPAAYGIPDEIVSQVDPVTLYTLCCLCQALLSAGLEDPYELYKHIHVSELANCIGSSVGGMLALRSVYRERYLDRPVQSDIIQESYINAIGAWMNMLLMGAAGPITSQVGACASAIEALDVGCAAIKAGTAKVAIVGGADDFQEEMSTEFGHMGATTSSDAQAAAGRPPSEMSRPMTTTRNGFVESAGCGIQIIMTAELALQMGVPIYAIVAYSQMSGDKIGRSVPAPGQGLLTAARETHDASHSPLLGLDFRLRQLKESIKEIRDWRDSKMQLLGTSLETAQTITQAAERRIRDAQDIWFNDIRKQNPDIAPMRAALATWGLTIDDITIASMHGTSTQANDKNESSVLHQQMTHLGRSAGNPLIAMSQKWLTGHPKGAAAAWMLNGCLQSLHTGIIPGNRNADNISAELRQYTHLVYPARTIRVAAGIKAFVLTSFGFGQKGGLMIGIAPRYLFSSINGREYDEYKGRVEVRQRQANRVFIDGVMHHSLFKAKSSSAWAPELEGRVFLDPQARASQQADGSYRFDVEDLHASKNPL